MFLSCTNDIRIVRHFFLISVMYQSWALSWTHQSPFTFLGRRFNCWFADEERETSHPLSDLWICSPNDPCRGSRSGVWSRWGPELPGRNLDTVITLSSTMPWMWRSNLWSSSADRTFSSSRKRETIRSAGEKDSGSWEGKRNSGGSSKIIS